MAYRLLFEPFVRTRHGALRHAFCLLGAALALGCQPQIGDECQTSVDCSQGGERLCDITQPGGYCTIFNCEPNTCPEDSACIAFGAQLSGASACSSADGLSRFTRSFCMRTCGSNDDCRGGYTCADVTGTPWHGLAVDRGRARRVCIVPPVGDEVPASRPAEVCDGPDVDSAGSGGAPD